ncbi:nicotinate-nucleotide adenylyltransferase [Parvibaculum sedimenti]|uniref:Probable nicotinate-nucleotide adenylyltransferase n=1 Tax=Parvibaculum sedimenti TaxID=2608632 RepID=A0A6N6VPR2_9HYPH|nr:nicotinate-nucleotide adenylyltransferase [Parvibaculum sedimenti]KAB7742177.1 nicotinate-nucleotide adenylyltransferase [Parvibaculum sedimenti]
MKRNEALAPGMTVGLLGGSFNPAHEGHLHLTRMCLRALALDRIWWLVSPQNPLKSASGMAPQAARVKAAEELVAKSGEPGIVVTDIETRLRTRFTIDTVRALKARHHDIRFVWLMGADNLLQLPRWAKWRELTREVPIAVYPRPDFTLKARLSPAATMLKSATLDQSDAALLAHVAPPALVFLEGPEHPASATSIRAARGES